LELSTDQDGYFYFDLNLSHPLETLGSWQAVELELVKPQIEGQKMVQTTGHILVPPPDAEFGVISDIDDTVIKTSATNLLKMARIVFLGNARTRVPFKGVAAFYKALQHGQNGQSNNPFFYVSSSPWNLYDLLVDVFELQNIPRGPLFLRDYGLSILETLPVDHKAYKLNHIKKVFDTYSYLPFVLIGDSGQEDPEIYKQVVHQYPGRVRAVYIRDVTAQERDRRVQTIVESVAAAGVEMQFVPDTVAAAEHAVQKGLISRTALFHIKADKVADEQKPSRVEQLLSQ
jgi:phosphatidate phosphatase APP1